MQDSEGDPGGPTNPQTGPTSYSRQPSDQMSDLKL